MEGAGPLGSGDLLMVGSSLTGPHLALHMPRPSRSTLVSDSLA